MFGGPGIHVLSMNRESQNSLLVRRSQEQSAEIETCPWVVVGS